MKMNYIFILAVICFACHKFKRTRATHFVKSRDEYSNNSSDDVTTCDVTALYCRLHDSYWYFKPTEHFLCELTQNCAGNVLGDECEMFLLLNF